ncbi:MAG: hypothetical protein HRU19_24665 [Pseudobacteriovorax sp.]|nr:hypothetical protein [Pseudobacteriovorax sp.]
MKNLLLVFVMLLSEFSLSAGIIVGNGNKKHNVINGQHHVVLEYNDMQTVKEALIDRENITFDDVELRPFQQHRNTIRAVDVKTQQLYIFSAE